MTSGTEENVVVGGSPVANGNASANANAAAAAANALNEAQARIMATPVADENAALNIMVSFLNIAQRRGVFSIDESAKIWECIKKFQKAA